MPDANPVILLNAGEFSPLMDGQVAHEKFSRSCRTLENMIPLLQGGATRRPPFNYVAETKTSASASSLKPFVWGATDEDVQAYIVEAGNGYLRFYTDLAQIVVDDTDAAITNGDFTSNITGWDDVSTGGGSNAIAHDSTNGRLSLVADGTAASDIGWAEQDVAVGAAYDTVEHVCRFEVIGMPGDKVDFRVGTSSGDDSVLSDVTCEVGYHCVPFTPGDGNNTIYIQFLNRGADQDKTVQIDNVSLIDDGALEIGAPYSASEVDDVMTTQSYDVQYWHHPDWPTYKLLRLGAAQFSLVEVNFQDGPYFNENTTSTTLLPSAATGYGINLTLSSTEGVNGGLGWQATDVGRLVRYKKTSAWGWAIITEITSTTIAVADVRGDFEATPTAQTTWRLGLWSATTGYPRASVFHDERLIAGPASISAPNRIDGSVVFDPENFAPGTDDDDPIAYSINAHEVPTIHWLLSAEMLVVGTGAGIAGVQRANVADVLTPGANVKARIRLYERAAALAPVVTPTALIFAERQKRQIHEMPVENLDIDGFTSADLTQLAENLTEGGLADTAWAYQPYQTLWAARADGTLVSMTYARAEKVVAWARHAVGGTFGGGGALVESVAAIPGNGYDEVWAVVKRTINGATKRYVEVMNAPFTGETAHEDGYFGIDSVVTLDSPVTVTGATQASPVVITCDTSTLTNGDQVRLSGFSGMTELNGKVYTVANASGSDFELTDSDGDNIDGTGFTAYVSGGAVNKMVTAVTGADHLEGEAVYAHADGATQGPFTVTSGAVTLDSAAGVVHLGLRAPSTVIPQYLEGANPEGSARGRRQRVIELGLQLWRTGGVQYGRDTSNLKTLPLRGDDDAMTAAAPLFTGLKTVSPKSNWENNTELALYFESTQPATVTCLVPRFSVEPG